MPTTKPLCPQLFRTKLYRPRLPRSMVERCRLLEPLKDALTVPLTLVSAPAGYGKSVLISHWAEVIGEPVAWLSLDERDGDLRTFLRYLLAAARDLYDQPCARTAELIGADVLPPVNELALHLLSDLDALPGSCTLVLDDYHHLSVQSPVHALLTCILEHPSPGCHWCLLSRQDPPLPLALLRARGELLEFRYYDLQFNDEETRQLLTCSTEASPLSSQAISNLSRDIEGWVTGLRLVSLVLARVAEPEVFLSDLRGDLTAVKDYLMQEVWARQPEALRELLLMAAITERFCAGLLDALGGDGEMGSMNGQTLIDHLRRDNLFIIALDEGGEWYRFHHLFRELLCDQLPRNRHILPATEVELQLRASRWFEQQGLIDEAQQYALLAGDVQRATELVAGSVQAIVAAGQWFQLELWLARLPESVIQQQPLLLLARAFKHYYHMETAALPGLLDRIEVLMADTQVPEELSGEVAVFRAYCALMTCDTDTGLRLLEAAMENAAMEPRPTRALAELLLALTSQMAGRVDQVRARLEDWLQQDGLPPIREANLAQAQLFIDHIDARPAHTQGLLLRARRFADAAGLRNLQPWNDYLDGMQHLQCGELEAALACFEGAAERRYFHHTRGAADAMCAAVVANQLLGQFEEADRLLGRLERFVEFRQPALTPLCEACAVRLALLRGERSSALQWLRTGADPALGAQLFWFELPAITWCRALIADGSQAALEAALKALSEHARAADEQHNTLHLSELMALLAQCQWLLGAKESALATQEEGLSMVQRGGFVFPWLELAAVHGEACIVFGETASAAGEEVLGKLAALRQDLAPQRASAGLSFARGSSLCDGCESECLTLREMDVLALLAERLRDKEIAKRLGIAPGTVKYHLKHIYQKLGVNDRTRAVSRATEVACLVAAGRGLHHR